MKAGEKKLIHFFEGEKKLIIPVYQRNYSWKKEQCKRLLEDLKSIMDNNKNHFLGSVVSIYDMDKEYLIIDGQQRITTISILLLAICNIIEDEYKDKNKDCDEYILKSKIIEQYLTNKFLHKDERIKLRLIEEDRIEYNKLFESDEDLNEDTNIATNYKYFKEEIINQKISLEKLTKAIESLMIVDIELKQGEDDPQLIFESLNSTGLDLSEADRIRNFVLMKVKLEEQEKIYNNYWKIIEKNTRDNTSEFVRDYLTIKERNIPNKNKVYVYFKEYVKDRNLDIEYLLKDLLIYSKYYRSIISENTGSKEVDKVLHNLNKLEVSVLNPFLLEILDDYKNGILKEQQLVNSLQTLESFVLRRAICEVPTNALNKLFMNLGKDIKKCKEYEKSYDSILENVLASKKLSQRFPNNDEFKEAFLNKDIYNMRSKIKLYLLEKLENFNNKEQVNVEEQLSSRVISIEHIMPQTLTDEWKRELGINYKKTYDNYLHTIGNITLTGYNSELGNKPFHEKRDQKNGFKYSKLYLNKYISECDVWNEEKIVKRAENLYNRSIEIWKYPNCKNINIDDEKIIGLDEEDFNFTGKNIVSFTILNKKYDINNWTSFYSEICKYIYSLDCVKFQKIVKESIIKELENKISIDSSKLRAPIKISKGIFVESNLSTESKLSVIRYLSKEVNLSLSDITVTIK